VNKSGLKVHIIKNIDRRQRLEDIASAKGIEVGDVLNELESIVSSGTRINIKYCIEEVIDEDSVEDIIEYFRESESDDIDEAINEFDGDFSEEELRMVRLQFYSDFGN
jgi:ATP-dependent DNA helicase RecQ